jgi:hypothetical protein
MIGKLQKLSNVDSIKLEWCLAERYYSGNIGQNGFGMEAVKKDVGAIIGTGLFVCSCSLTTQGSGVSLKIMPIVNLLKFC